jgi:ABC-2 type transport system permease protein
VPATLAIMAMTAFGFSALGVALASLKQMKSFEGFFAMINMLMFPLIFASGAFFPLMNLPDWFWAITYADPLTYAVDAMRYALTGVNYFDPLMDILVLIAFDVVAVLFATKLFERVGLD